MAVRGKYYHGERDALPDFICLEGGYDMSGKAMNIAKTIACGMIIGGTIGASVAFTVKKPTVKMFKKKTAGAIDTVGAIMRSVADFVG